MAGKISRKGKNPGPVDAWLDELGYYRKNVAYDETCLFRAVSEQLFSCQLFHEKVRKECIDYARDNYREFENLFPNKNEWDHHLDKLSTHMAICGNIEIHIISKKYKRNILLFDSINGRVREILKTQYNETLLLCLMTEDHYDVVYSKEYIADAGFCQSIVYSALYENVFEIPQVPSIVQAMLYDKPPFLTASNEGYSSESSHNGSKKSNDSDKSSHYIDIKKAVDPPVKPDHMTDYEFMIQTNLAPFPFKVAKALDPSIYRNIEYDTWTEMRKEMRLGDWYYGDNNLILGTRCILQDNGQKYQCYIQDIIKEKSQCIVFMLNTAERRTVRYCDLSPENDAKPWPLPYRFSKNLIICQPEAADRDRKNAKKRKDKKRSNSKSSNDSGKGSTPNRLTLDINESVTAYEGCPLQMHQVEPEPEKTPCPMESTDCYNDPSVVQWSVVPPDVPYTVQEPCFYYDNVYPYGIWNNMNMSQDQQMTHSPPSDVPMSPDTPYSYIYYPPDTSYPPPPPPTLHSPKICMPMTPSSPQIEMYHPPLFAQPGTPVIYATPEIPEMVMPPPQSLALFTPPPIEFITSSPYCMIPSTPPAAAWYPPGINAHGFIFPTATVAPPNIPARM